MNLWRPVGLKELELIFDSNMKAFPPRLPEQPIFYPVLNRKYAEKIAKDWNTTETSAVGYVIHIELPDEFSEKYERQIVGDSTCEEWWVPAEELPTFNTAIRSLTVESAFFGLGYTGFIGTAAGIKNKNAKEQFQALARCLSYSSFDVWCETYVNRKAVFLNCLFWASLDPNDAGVSQQEKAKLLDFIAYRWSQSDIPFPCRFWARGITRQMPHQSVDIPRQFRQFVRPYGKYPFSGQAGPRRDSAPCS